ncbi:MAG: penicillin acylase family protein [Acidobacteria bacterium]|nr:penicillin acylase family protein [Acidobacteriota bacterium]
MRGSLIALLLIASFCFAADPAELRRWEAQAKKVKIVRDSWGIAHIYGKTDADTVFGALYAQAEDDFNRVETNYINAMGRLAEAEGELLIYQDLRMKLFVEPETLKKQYAASPAWMKKLMDAFADGLNFYLAKHPAVKPRVITRFEPWMALSFTEGSIGGDIERVNLNQLEAFYGKPASTLARVEVDDLMKEPSGSNGVAIGPANTKNKASLLLINPHTSFYFRSELQMVSGEGLNAYGASTWGQFFIYQGFNEKCGWMHTSSGADVIDEYLETVTQKGEQFYYKFGNDEKLLSSRVVTVPYLTKTGMAEKKFTVFFSQHGPIVRSLNGKWVAVRLMQEPVKALQQSYLRTKAKDYKSFRETMELKTNSSNNTIFADASGHIAYFHGNYMPKRDVAFDWTKPVDGANPATEYKGLHTIDETPNLLDPKAGWLYNANDFPWWAAGKDSLKKDAYPVYVESGTASARGVHALKVFEGKTDFTVESLLAAAYDSYLPWFERPLPALIRALKNSDTNWREQLAVLEKWDLRWSVDSVATSVAVFWGEEARRLAMPAARREGVLVEEYLGTKAPPALMLEALGAAMVKLERIGGTWKIPWGEINRFQRLTGDIVHPFDDTKASIPVGFTSAIWGSLASFGARPQAGTKKWYGTSGNSFVAVVEFGKKLRAVAISAGGESGDPNSKHFNDQQDRYAKGALREVYFYPAAVKANSEREYRPGNR